MGIVDKIVEGFVDGLLPGIVCPIIRQSAGEGCVNLESAIQKNESLLHAYKDKADETGLWDYDTVKDYARKFPNAKKMINEEKVISWLRKSGDDDIVNTITQTPGGMLWLKQQIDDFKNDLFGVDE